MKNKKLSHPTVRTSKGLTLLNFSSPHRILFNDGSILEACSKELCEQLSVERHDEEYIGRDFIDVVASFTLPKHAEEALIELENNNKIDVVIVSLETLKAIEDSGKKMRKPRVLLGCNRTERNYYHNKFSVLSPPYKKCLNCGQDTNLQDLCEYIWCDYCRDK